MLDSLHRTLRIPAATQPSRPAPAMTGYDSDSDLVFLKITILGDSQIGKTTFLIKYVGDEEETRSLQMKGLHLMDKRGARILNRLHCHTATMPLLLCGLSPPPCLSFSAASLSSHITCV